MRSFANYGLNSAIKMSEENFVFNVSPETFQAEVIERSKQLPVMLIFWADQVPPSVETRDVLMRLVAQAQGKVFDSEHELKKTAKEIGFGVFHRRIAIGGRQQYVIMSPAGNVRANFLENGMTVI
jgi:hypothetical protein